MVSVVVGFEDSLVTSYERGRGCDSYLDGNSNAV